MTVKDFFLNFFISFFSIFLGMLCTFVGQGMIDRAADRKEVRTSLELIRTELVKNREDIKEMCELMEKERKSAQYFLDNRSKIDRCPADSINYHGGLVFADISIVLTQDALELLKMSSMFQKIGDNNTSMKIIRAYETCSSSASYLNGHEETKSQMIGNGINDRTVQRTDPPGGINVKEYIKSGYGLYFMRWLSTSFFDYDLQAATDLNSAIEAIDDYLTPVRIKRKQHKQ